MLKRPQYIALAIVVLLVLVLLNLPTRTANQLKLAFSSLFLPLVGITRSTQQAAKQGGDAITSRADLVKEITELRKTNELLQLRAMEAEALKHQNDQLRDEIGWQKRVPWKLKPANVVFQEPGNFFRTIRIDVGTSSGNEIRPDLAVLTKDGLVGRIQTVGLTTSVVVLIGTADCRVAATIDKADDFGVITGGAGPIDRSLVTLSYLHTQNAKPGQLVYTSGKGGLFPPGIRIGQIVETPRMAEMGSLEARVKLSANLGALDIVWVRLQ